MVCYRTDDQVRSYNKSSLNWSVVLVKEKLKTHQLLRKQSLERNGYSWRKKAERREQPRKGFRENESNLRSLCRRLFFTIRGQCIHGYLFYISTARCSCFVKCICQFGQDTYDSLHAACFHIAQSSHFNSYEIYTLLSYLTKPFIEQYLKEQAIKI